MVLKFYKSVAKRLKLKVRKILGLSPTFVEVTEEKLVGDLFETPSCIGLKVLLLEQTLNWPVVTKGHPYLNKSAAFICRFV